MLFKIPYYTYPIFFLHGFMGTALAHFGSVLKAWYKKYPLIGLDLPGHGRSSEVGKKNYYQGCFDYVLHKIRPYGCVNLIGASYLGGTIAAKIARFFPDLVHTIVLTGFSYNIPQPAFYSWAIGFKELSQENPILKEEYQRLHGSRWENTIELLIHNCLHGYEEDIFISTDFMRQVKVRTLLVNGDYKQNELSASERIASDNFLAKGIIIKEAGHLVPFHQPAEFCKQVELFWRQERSHD